MGLVEIAQIYTDLVKLERQIPEDEFQSKDLVNALRTKYHELLMAKMRQENIEFADRFDAANKAFEILQQSKLSA